MGETAEVAARFLGGLAAERHVQAAADPVSDLPERHALFGDAVITGSRGTLLEHQPEEMGGVEPVHRGPAVESFAHIRRNTLLTGETDEKRNEAVITVAVDRWR